MTKNPPLQKAIDRAGGQVQLAKAIGTSQSQIWYWLQRSKRGVPAEYVVAIERVTGVPRHELRPDLFTEGDAPEMSSAPPPFAQPSGGRAGPTLGTNEASKISLAASLVV